MAIKRDTPLSMTPDPGNKNAYGKPRPPDTRTPEVRKIDSILNANKDKEFVKRLYDKNPESIQVKGQKGRSTHLMESADGAVYPRVDRDPKTKKLVNMGDTSYNYHMRTKNYVKLKDDKEAQWFGENYKKGTGVLKGKLKR